VERGIDFQMFEENSYLSPPPKKKNKKEKEKKMIKENRLQRI
jgi:hypothetical protein